MIPSLWFSGIPPFILFFQVFLDHFAALRAVDVTAAQNGKPLEPNYPQELWGCTDELIDPKSSNSLPNVISATSVGSLGLSTPFAPCNNIMFGVVTHPWR